MSTILNIAPEDWVRSTNVHAAVDTVIALRIRYKGPYAYAFAIVTNNAVRDLWFRHGDTTTVACGATGLTLGSTLGGQPVTGATVGKLDLTVYTTAYSVMRAINASLYWEAWLEDVPCGMLTNKSAGVGVFLVRATTTGYNLVDVASDSSLNQINLDTSVHPTGGKHYVGITFAKGSDFTHATDHQVLHEILEVCAQATFGTTAGTISLYACDDDSGVDTTLESYTYAIASSGTKIYFPVGGNNGEPYQSTKGKRFVAGFSCGISSTADTLAPYLRVIARSYAFGPAVRNSKLWQNQQ